MFEGDILERLRFDTISDRQERIPTAFTNTFEWVFRPHTEQTDQEEFDNYVQWLKGDKPLYWITGKPGAGKSTLLKYLFNDQRTVNFAKLWSEDKRLTCAGFFFWNSGMELQMSKEGLIRTLLFQILTQTRDLIPTVFSESWKQYELWGGDQSEWAWERLVDCLKALISDQSQKYLLFIDGMDEFAGDYTELVDFIVEISQKPNVKLCVASRPWLAFEEAFGKRPRLKVETLTKNDIENFVSKKLELSHRFLDLQRDEPASAKFLINEVTGKAQGVFL